jgi:orotate phosphoribosyltransferase
MDFRQDFIEFAVGCKVLRFGEFKTKAGRLSPYFFNAGLFNDGNSLGRLAEFYAKAAETGAIQFNMLFGPAYKGIPLVAAISIALAQRGSNFQFATTARKPRITARGAVLLARP